MADETSTAPVAAETPAPAETTPEVATATTEAKTTTETDAKPSLVDKVKEAREKVEADAKPEEKPEAKAEDKSKDGGKKDDGDKEPENLTPEDRNRVAWIKQQRDTQLQEAAKIAEERKALEAEKAEIEKAKAEIAAKPKTDDAKKDPPADQPAAVELEHYKPPKLAAYEDGEHNPNEQALLGGMEALAKDVQFVKTVIASRDAEIAQLKVDNDRLMKLAAPYIPDESGVTPAETQYAAKYLESQAKLAVDELAGEFGPESGLKINAENLLGAWLEFSKSFISLGELKADESIYSKDSILHCWRHANKTEIEAAKAKGNGKPKEEKQKPPPVRKSEGGNTAPPSLEQMTPRERMIHRLQQENARIAQAN